MKALALAAGLLIATGAGASPLPTPRPAASVAAETTAAPLARAAPLSAPAAAARPARLGPPMGADRTPATAPVAQGAGLCGDPRLQGRRLQRIGSGAGCGIAAPVSLTAVAGVRLTPAATVNCDTARALADWVESSVRPAAEAHKGSRVVGLDVAASYACRRVNNRPSGKLSEHSIGNAVDISGFRLADGRHVSLLTGWRSDSGAFLRGVWSGACGPFGTVLGPEADRWHQDHFHFDVAQRTHGPVCR